MVILVCLLIAAGIVIFVLYKNNKDQLLTIHNYEDEIQNLKEQSVLTEKKLAEDYKKALDRKTAELQMKQDSRISILNEQHAKELENLQCRIEVRKGELYQKNEKELLVDVVLVLGALIKSKEAISDGVIRSHK